MRAAEHSLVCRKEILVLLGTMPEKDCFVRSCRGLVACSFHVPMVPIGETVVLFTLFSVEDAEAE